MRPLINSKRVQKLQQEKETILADKRFSHVYKDPKFKNYRKDKIKVGKEFAKALKKNTAIDALDPRGKKGNYASKAELLKYYNLSSDEDSDKEEETDEEDDENKQPQLSEKDVKQKFKDMNVDYGRGEGDFPDDSSDGESSEDEVDEEEVAIEDVDDNIIWETEDNPVEETKRLALCNFNWECVKVQDIMALVSSFASKKGCVKKVSLYLSQFGKERLEDEEKFGPRYSKKSNNVDEDEDEENASDVNDSDNENVEKSLEYRKYILERMRYYYAVIECDSVEAASEIYKECDKSDFIDSSDVAIDLRYIPDDMEFDEEPTEVCESVPDSYSFVCFEKNLTSSTDMGWDITDKRRTKVLHEAFSKKGNLDSTDLTALEEFVGSGSSSEDEEHDERRSKLKKKLKFLLEKIDNEEDIESDLDMEQAHMMDSSDEEEEEENRRKISRTKKRKRGSISSDEEKTPKTCNRDELAMLVDDESAHFKISDKPEVKKGRMGKGEYRRLKRKEMKKLKKEKSNFSNNINNPQKIITEYIKSKEDPRFSQISTGRYNIEASEILFDYKSQIQSIQKYVKDFNIENGS